MKTYFFILFLCPVVLFAQNQQVPPANGATDCPTFGKKNTSGKAGLFQYMRTNRPSKNPQQPAYTATALPTLKPTPAEEEVIAQKRQKRAAERKQRAAENNAAKAKEPVAPSYVKASDEKPSRAKVTDERPTADKVYKPTNKVANVENVDDKPSSAKASDDKEASIEEEATAAENSKNLAETRDKKVRKAAFKGKMQRLFKRTNKPTSRKNVQKCPQF